MEKKKTEKMYIVDYSEGLTWNVYQDVEDAKNVAYDLIIAQARKRHKLACIREDVDGLGWYFFTRAKVHWARVRALTLK